MNWRLFSLLLLVSVPGVVTSVPVTIKSLKTNMADRLPPGKTLPSNSVLIPLSILQSLLFVAITTAVGVLLSPRVGFAAPAFEALSSGKSLNETLVPQLVPAIILGVGGALVIVAVYYLLFRPSLDRQTIESMETLRMRLGLSARILYGGIVEEILFRWGLMTLLVWLSSLIVEPTPLLIWGVIVFSGVLFGLGHLPAYLGAGCQKSWLFIVMMISLNLWATLICGWLYWQHGLMAAMIAHMLYHLVWYPFDLHFTQLAQFSRTY